MRTRERACVCGVRACVRVWRACVRVRVRGVCAEDFFFYANVCHSVVALASLAANHMLTDVIVSLSGACLGREGGEAGGARTRRLLSIPAPRAQARTYAKLSI